MDEILRRTYESFWITKQKELPGMRMVVFSLNLNYGYAISQEKV